jgi:hypothetical protein
MRTVLHLTRLHPPPSALPQPRNLVKATKKGISHRYFNVLSRLRCQTLGHPTFPCLLTAS